MIKFIRMFTAVILLGTIALTTAACAPTVNVRGHLLQDYDLAEVQPGSDTRSDVLRKLGSPTTTAPFDESTWYYIGQRTEKRGIFDPRVVEERIVEARFDETGMLVALEEVDADRINVPLVRRTTPTSGHEVTAIEQFVGNLGRFNRPDAPAR